MPVAGLILFDQLGVLLRYRTMYFCGGSLVTIKRHPHQRLLVLMRWNVSAKLHLEAPMILLDPVSIVLPYNSKS